MSNENSTKSEGRKEGDRGVRDFSQEGYLIVSPSPHKGGLPQIISFRHTHGAADTRAQSLEKAYSKGSYPCGLIVVPCSVSFSIPNAMKAE